MGLSNSAIGRLVGWINIGTVLAYLVVRAADQWGRRPILTLTIVGYTTMTFATALSPGVASFGIAQLIARIFLIAEIIISIVYVAETFPAEKRGTTIGILQGASTLGAIICAITTPWFIDSILGWRGVYFVGILPLIMVGIIRRNIQETPRFLEQKQRLDKRRPSFFHIWKTPYRYRVIKLSVLWGLMYTSYTTAVFFWKTFALDEAGAGLSEKQAGISIAIAAFISMPLIFFCGKWLDWAGRKHGGASIFAIGMIGIWGSYSTAHHGWITFFLVLAIFGSSAVLPVLNTFSVELFPTHMRADAFAWSSNLLGRITYITTPILIGTAAESIGWQIPVRLTLIAPLIAIFLIYLWLPETKNRELEDTSRLS